MAGIAGFLVCKIGIRNWAEKRIKKVFHEFKSAREWDAEASKLLLDELKKVRARHDEGRYANFGLKVRGPALPGSFLTYEGLIHLLTTSLPSLSETYLPVLVSIFRYFDGTLVELVEQLAANPVYDAPVEKYTKEVAMDAVNKCIGKFVEVAETDGFWRTAHTEVKKWNKEIFEAALEKCRCSPPRLRLRCPWVSHAGPSTSLMTAAQSWFHTTNSFHRRQSLLYEQIVTSTMKTCYCTVNSAGYRA